MFELCSDRSDQLFKLKRVIVSSFFCVIDSGNVFLKMVSAFLGPWVRILPFWGIDSGIHGAESVKREAA